MSYDWSAGGTQRYIKLKEGDSLVFKVLEMEEVANSNPQYNLKGKDYYIKVTTDKGILSVNTWGLYFACQGVQMREGKTYSIKYLKKGTIGRPSQYELFEIPEEKEPF